MKYMQIIFIVLSLSSALVLSTNSHASTEHEHSEASETGPNGGTLLTDGDLSVEITMFDLGGPPEMRVYTYSNGRIVTPNDVNLTLTLHRLGDINETLSFTPEDNYLVSNEVVTEPHSYKVSVFVDARGLRSEWHYESFEGRTILTDRIIDRAGIVVERAGAQTLNFKEQLFGVVAPVTGNIISITPTYRGRVTDVLVSVGDRVTEGQILVKVINASSGVSYDVVSPTQGEVTERFVSVGEVVNEQILLEIANLSSVWVELSAFPENIEQLRVGQTADVFDLHQHKRIRGEVIYISPIMTGGHIARARVLIDNSSGHWRPGMHVKADVKVREREVRMAVQVDAIQSFRDMPAVFARYGNTFEVRMVELGESDGEYTEVISGLAPNTSYVTDNSYIIKAEILKDGASHGH